MNTDAARARPTDVGPVDAGAADARGIDAPTIDASPDELARLVGGRPRPCLVGLDVDGVLAPIVARADEAQLTPGVAEVLRELTGLTSVAVVSGRSLADLDRLFGIPEGIHVIGSHGLEERGRAPLALDQVERERLDRLMDLAEQAASAAGAGAWVEHKPASVVLHVREADPALGGAAVERLGELASTVDGAHVKAGHAVVEMMARRTSKAIAIEELRGRLGARSVVFAGDDRTDEEVFAVLGADDLSVRVGPGETLAARRLPDPDAVLAWLRALVAELSSSTAP